MSERVIRSPVTPGHVVKAIGYLQPDPTCVNDPKQTRRVRRAPEKALTKRDTQFKEPLSTQNEFKEEDYIQPRPFADVPRAERT
jgi:hypothetical protein